MWRSRKVWAAACALGLWAPAAYGQVGGAAAPAAPAAPAAGADAAAAAKPGLGAKICKGLQALRAQMCATPKGQLLNSLTQPLSQLSGGVIPSFCPAMPSAAELAKPGVEGAAAQAKKDALEAKARRQAVRFLGTLDCRYYTEAEPALIAALRTDRSDCVRFEAALALGHGCCCTRKTIAALEIVVAGSDRDGNPAERCMRVRDAAYAALSRCCCSFLEVKEAEPVAAPVEPVPAGTEQLPKPPAKTPPAGTQAKGAAKEDAKPRTSQRIDLSRKEDRALIERVRKTLADYERQSPTAALSLSQGFGASNPKDMLTLVKFAVDGGPPQSMTAPATMAPPMAAAVPTPTPMAMTVSPQRQPTMKVAVEVRPAAMTTPATSSPVAAQLTTLRKSAQVSERHAAVRILSTTDWKQHPEVTTTLLEAAYTDSAPAVRVDCIRCLVYQKMATPAVLAHLKNLAVDPDPWVAKEAGQAVAYLQSLPAGSSQK